jgi:ATP-dependent exoDNAse (exonuclease V) beta subunit
VYLLYNTETDDYGAGEKSRFITQLNVDGFYVEKRTVSPKVTSSKKEQIIIEKTPEIIEKLKIIAERGFSPSALATYVTNPLTYYKRYILGIKDLEEVEETIAFNTLGTVVHEVLEGFYEPLVGKLLQEDNLKKMFANIEGSVEKCFQKYYKNGNIKQGKNKLIAKVAETFISNFLKSEQRLIASGKQLKILGTEKKIKATIKIDELDFPINIHGEVDRIDELDGVQRIVDYKTGKVEEKDLILKDITTISQDYKYTKALQVMLYAFLYTRNNKSIFDSSLQAGIFSFKNQKAGFMKMTFGEKRSKDFSVTENRVEEYMDVIKELIKEIFDINKPFEENLESPY